jgi:hypothetical protein
VAALCQKLTELLRQAKVLTSDRLAIAGPAVVKLAPVCKLAISTIQEDVRGADCIICPGQISRDTSHGQTDVAQGACDGVKPSAGTTYLATSWLSSYRYGNGRDLALAKSAILSGPSYIP